MQGRNELGGGGGVGGGGGDTPNNISQSAFKANEASKVLEQGLVQNKLAVGKEICWFSHDHALNTFSMCCVVH